MIKNLQVFSSSKSINKLLVHKLVGTLKKELNLQIDSLVINFVSETEITELNEKYLDHYYSTDIITFDYSEDCIEIDGEIFISMDDAELNARKYKVHLKNEITRLIIHGILHLLGYDDQQKKDKIIMKRMENDLTNRNKFILLRGR
ncbi:MAG: rRNA maturation RNase YbeY [Ignavibacteriaceae bacterium]|nr:rRNA maturation RNase YbeY [Ignavibacteriaceae bacterium]